jgi:hypothetical protein
VRLGSGRFARSRALLGVAVLTLLAAAAPLAACHDPVREQAERDDRDHARLAAIVQADAALDRVLKSADDASHAGDDAKAADILEGDATHAATDAVAQAEAEREAMETPWGRARRDALAAVLRERQAAIAPYAAAARGDDLDAKLATVIQQLELQKKAVAAATAALAPPGSAASDSLVGQTCSPAGSCAGADAG